MIMRKPKSRRGKRKKHIDPAKLAQRRQKQAIRSLFARIGFSRIQSDGIEFSFDGRTGEVDDIFIQENVAIICEYTTGRASAEHVAKKSILYKKIIDNQSGWVSSYSDKNQAFSSAVQNSEYTNGQFRVRIVYVSSDGVSEEIENAFQYITFFDGTRLRYFDALSKTIHRSARHELFKYLKLDYKEIGSEVHSPKNSSRNFTGHLLPEAHSGYPPGFKLVSFYADPESLLAISYVLRKDSWRDGEGLYQRILIKGKIAKMRKYLVEAKRVFVNNIIVTLPSNTSLNDPTNASRNIDSSQLERGCSVLVGVPFSANMIGLVDGQHRVFCYYEGKDPLENKIAALRKRQNLLITGLIFPNSWSEARRREFEAKLFLEINDNQAKARSALKQGIELILNPFSTIAIAKEVVNRLSSKGPLSGLLQASFFDPPEKIKTTSIVSYGLRPLIKLEGTDSLFASWQNSSKQKIADDQVSVTERKLLLDEYLQYCVGRINDFLIAAKLNLDDSKWILHKKRNQQFLTPTVINGFFVCIRRLSERSLLTNRSAYETKLKGISAFNFSKYKSSGWRALGDKLFDDYFGS